MDLICSIASSGARAAGTAGETVASVDVLSDATSTQIAMRATLLLSIAASALAETKSYAAAHASHAIAHSSAILSPRPAPPRPPN